MKEIRIEMDNTYMNVIKFGNGQKNLVIIAGVSLMGLEGCGSALEASFASFVDEYTVYVFDRKKVLREGYSLEKMADDIYRCLVELRVDHAAFYGASQGGMIAQLITLSHPEMVEKLIVASSMCKATEKVKKTVAAWQKKALKYDIIGLNRLFFQTVYSEKFLDSVKDMLPELEKVGTDEACDRFLILTDPIYNFDISDQIKNITCPVLVLGDENDQVIGAEGSYKIAEILGCQIKMYDQYSHAVYDECPEIKDTILEFLHYNHLYQKVA